MHDFRARAYDSSLGRFTSRDPIAGVTTLPASLNPYQYGYNNPLKYTDTNGRQAVGPNWAPLWESAGDYIGGVITDAGEGAAYWVCGSCEPAGHYLLSNDESMQFDWLPFAVNGVLDIPVFKPLKIGYKAGEGAVKGGAWVLRAIRGSDEAARAGKRADEVLEGLPKGRQPHVRTVGSEDELRSVYDELAAGGKPVDVPGYPGKWVERPDGTRVGIREQSKSGGATIDVRRPDGSIQKVHIG